MENIKISTLEEFIKVMGELSEVRWYFRGESKDYGESKNLASGYRWIKANNKVFMDLLNLRKEFFREVGSKLSLKEIENFIAYSQHHGLPTELLDITLNPLVALYFACESNSGEDGYVYLFNNTPYNMLSDIKNNFRDIGQFYYSPYRNLTEKIFSQDIAQQKIWFRWHENTENNLQRELLEQENEYVYELFNGSDMTCIRQEFKTSLQKLRANDPYKLDIERMCTYCRTLPNSDIVSQRKVYIAMIFRLMRATNGEFFPTLKYLLVRPTIVFDRMKNQQGDFIYQLNTSMGDDVGLFQPIIPAKTIKIPAERKEEIMKQLNLIGINKKFIYSDDDSIAEYLKNNYRDSFSKLMNPYI